MQPLPRDFLLYAISNTAGVTHSMSSGGTNDGECLTYLAFSGRHAILDYLCMHIPSRPSLLAKLAVHTRWMAATMTRD
jgi:hypothetical protein